MEQKVTILNERQENLLALLKQTFREDPERYLSSKEVKSLMASNQHGNYEGPEPEFSDENVFKVINEDYHAINESTNTDMIVISSRNKGYKLATKAEYRSHSKRQWRSIAKAICRQKRLDHKAHKDGTMDIVDERIIHAFEVIEESMGEAE